MADARSALIPTGWVLFALTLGASSCGPSPSPATALASSTPPTASPPPADLTTGAAGAVRLARFNLTLPLPDIDAWRIDDRRSSWLVASHAAAESSLAVRVWREDENMNRTRCEERARLSHALPSRDGADVLERRAIDIPEGFGTVVEIAVTPPAAPGERLVGFAMAFGGWAKKCFAYAFVTSATGNGAEELVGRRLATMVQRSLGRIAIESELAPTIPHEPGH